MTWRTAEQIAAIEAKYRGKAFRFRTPFEYTPGWEKGDTGTIVRLMSAYNGDAVEAETEDLWVARNDRTGTEHAIWGGECVHPTEPAPLIPEHQFRLSEFYR